MKRRCLVAVRIFFAGYPFDISWKDFFFFVMPPRIQCYPCPAIRSTPSASEMALASCVYFFSRKQFAFKVFKWGIRVLRTHFSFFLLGVLFKMKIF